LKSVLDFLNAFRMNFQTDNYFGGRDILKAENSNVTLSHQIFVISDFLDNEFLNNCNAALRSKNVAFRSSSSCAGTSRSLSSTSTSKASTTT